MPSERLEIEGAGNDQNKKTGNGRNEKAGNGRNKRPETAGQAAGRQPKRRPAAGNELKNFERGILACNTHYDGKGF